MWRFVFLLIFFFMIFGRSRVACVYRCVQRIVFTVSTGGQSWVRAPVATHPSRALCPLSLFYMRWMPIGRGYSSDRYLSGLKCLFLPHILPPPPPPPFSLFFTLFFYHQACGDPFYQQRGENKNEGGGKKKLAIHGDISQDQPQLQQSNNGIVN